MYIISFTGLNNDALGQMLSSSRSSTLILSSYQDDVQSIVFEVMVRPFYAVERDTTWAMTTTVFNNNNNKRGGEVARTSSLDR